MRKKARRFVALLVCMSMVSTGSALAMSNNDTIDSVTKRGIQEQLAEQDALEMLDIHEYIYSTTNSINVPYGSEDEYTNVYAPYGGMMEYVTRKNGKTLDVANTYLDRVNAYYFILTQQEVGIGDVVIAILGYIPLVGPLASTIANAKAIINSGTATSIKNAGGYAQIILTKAYDGTAVSIEGWTRYPYIYLYDLQALNIRTTVFEEHDPFE